MASATSNKNTEIDKFFFTPVPRISDKFLCKCGKERKQNPKRGHGNLLEHITREHKNYLEEVRFNGIKSVFSIVISDKARNIYGWLDWICTGPLFNFVEKKATRMYTNLLTSAC